MCNYQWINGNTVPLFLFTIGVSSVVPVIENTCFVFPGYSVLEERKLLSRDHDTVVTGSPRDESKGSVRLGEQTLNRIQIIHTILGEQVGSYFGSSLAVTDLNNDEYVCTQSVGILTVHFYFHPR